ncbi:hypothetical protein [Mucilaginibacter sp. L196]|uniref:hypothetical protein n=1 Tax=Mucilaginibacter sp. L196 TaxID=1641870 RepID=UPI00131C252F|nr:hypothetical protein [Mucilaginibacter sp. L196]
MKKIIIAAALVCTTGALASRVKINNTPKVVVKAAIQNSFSADSKELASGD